MKKLFAVMLCLLMILTTLVSCTEAHNTSDTDSEDTSEVNKSMFTFSDDYLVDKIRGSWLGQTAGVVWGADQEFHFRGTIMPDDKVPAIESLNLNDVLWQDDLYVEIPYMESLLKYGVNCSIDEFAEGFKASTYGLDHANKIGRENLQKGIPAAQCGHYSNNLHCDDIDWQIEVDFLGAMYPALVNDAASRAFELGHITNYVDGVYGGVFIAAMHAAAFYAENVRQIIDAGMAVIPDGTKFKQLQQDVIDCYESGQTWQECHSMLQEKWNGTKRCPWYAPHPTNIDAKMNSGYVLIGLLYGEGDFDKSMQIAMQCGQDSDCNPSSVGGILGSFYGYDKIDSKWKTINETSGTFTATNYTYKQAVDMNVSLARNVLESKGYTKDENGNWTVFTDSEYTAVPFEQWPDMPTLEIKVSKNGTDTVAASATAHDIGGEVTYLWNMGDGAEYKSSACAHVYKEIGEYEIVCTVTNKNGNSVTQSKTVKITTVAEAKPAVDGEYRNLASEGSIVCDEFTPVGGGGNKDIEIIRDGVKSGSDMQQYDTYSNLTVHQFEFVGYMFRETHKMDKVVFTEGKHFDNGGWFVGETLKLEGLVDGVWTELDCTVTPEYPTGNAMSNYGAFFETYTFTFEETVLSGIRLSGQAGGYAGFIGIAELEVYGK